MKNTEILVPSKLSYEKNMIIRDDDTKEVFRVLACKKSGDGYLLSLLNMTKENKQRELLKELKDALNGVKMHDKESFMIENIISSLEDTL